MNKEIAVCPDDGYPLVGTFMRSGAEFYCLKCRGSYGMFYEDHAKATPARLKKKEEAEIIVGFLRGFIHTGGGQIRGCKKCFPTNCEGQLHVQHLTEKEKSENEVAELILQKLSKAK